VLEGNLQGKPSSDWSNQLQLIAFVTYVMFSPRRFVSTYNSIFYC